MDSLFEAAEYCLQLTGLSEKINQTRLLAAAWRNGELSLADYAPPQAIHQPGRPVRPELIRPAAVPKRSLGTAEGRAALIHAITHIEFNAINLAWDAVYRFRDHPRDYFDDWVRVADEEAYHFQLLQARLQQLGYDYGDFPAHNGLWEMAVKTDFDPLIRMALVPRVLEARGLDVTPGMVKKLQQLGDQATIAILDIILRDEIGHVAIGTRWFQYHCDLRGLEMRPTFLTLVQQYYSGALRGPYFYPARLQAGFSEAELQQMEQLFGT